jgi:ArsR family transcriptional regulator
MSDALSPPVNLQTLAEQLKVLAEPKRLLILNLLMDGVQCNCELGDALQMAPNLISHHLSVLRQAGLVDMERDFLDSRWVYYSINRAALDELNATFDLFFDPARIQPRRPTCGPSAAVCPPNGATSQTQTILLEKKQS